MFEIYRHSDYRLAKEKTMNPILPPAPLNCGYYRFGQHYRLSNLAYFVFGSNLKGIHGAGAAKTAAMYFGAQFGKGEGLTGRAYALPTKDLEIRPRRLPHVIESIKQFVSVTNMVNLEAFDEDQSWFYVTPTGTGLAGFPHEKIAPHFRGATRCWFPDIWRPFLGNNPGLYPDADPETGIDTAIYADDLIASLAQG